MDWKPSLMMHCSQTLADEGEVETELNSSIQIAMENCS